jgi:phosphoserine phosphatase
MNNFNFRADRTSSSDALSTAIQNPHNIPDIRLVCFDLDGTLLDGTIFIWQTLHDQLQTDRSLREQAKKDYFAGKISYQEWFEHDLCMFQTVNANREMILDALKGISLMNGAQETLDTLRQRGYRLAVLSGSIDLAITQFFPYMNFEHVMINEIYFEHTGKLIGGKHTPYDLEKKADGLIEIARREDLDLHNCCFVGDNFNDIQAMQVAGFGFSFNSKSAELDRVADVVIKERDLRAILPYLPPLLID